VTLQDILGAIKACCECRVSDLRIDGSREERILRTVLLQLSCCFLELPFILGEENPWNRSYFVVMNKECEHIVTGSPDDGSRLRVS
jgi:hypothetical protein